MSGAIYKPGQGYWVRALSAVFFGAITLAAAGWGWGQAGAYDLPIAAYEFAVRGLDQVPAEGQPVTLLGESLDRDNALDPIAGAVVQGYTPTGDDAGTIRLENTEITDPRFIPAEAVRLRAGDPAAPDFTASVQQGTAIAIPVFPQVYLQAGVAALITLLGAVLIYVFVAFKRSSVEFLIATDGEMKKVNWSSRKEVVGSTWVVIIAAFLIAAVLFVIDIGFSNAFQFVGVLER